MLKSTLCRDRLERDGPFWASVFTAISGLKARYPAASKSSQTKEPATMRLILVRRVVNLSPMAYAFRQSVESTMVQISDISTASFDPTGHNDIDIRVEARENRSPRLGQRRVWHVLPAAEL